MQKENIHYSYRVIDGYNAPLNIVTSMRGLGKTFGKVKDCQRDFVEDLLQRKPHPRQFVYVVETEDMVVELSQNHGDKFFSALREYYEGRDSKRAQRILEMISGDQGGLTETELDAKGDTKIKGGTIIIGGQTAGYLLSWNAFAKVKRNNFPFVSTIIIDEFIPETIDKRSLENARKMVSIIQSVARLREVKVYMMGNAIRMNDNILVKLHLNNMKRGEIRCIRDKYGLLCVAHYVDNNQYEAFSIKSQESVAGRIASLFSEDNLDKNEFRDKLGENETLPESLKPSHLWICLHGDEGSVRLNITKGHEEIYCLEDYGKNKNNRICINKKYQTDIVSFQPWFLDNIISYYTKGKIKFENSYTKFLLCLICGLKTN